MSAAELPHGRDSATPDWSALLSALASGEVQLDGRLVESSNNAMVGAVHGDASGDTHGAQYTTQSIVRCVYKPIRGERPLWDFPGGRLACREVAAFLVAQAAGWQVPPPTVLRDGPFGEGMVQRWIEGAEPDRVASVFPVDQLPDGWLPVLHAEDQDGQPLVVAHADLPELATIALFDIVVNNADRKASHLLVAPDGELFGVDHGLTFHTEPKLRTILWGWAGHPITPDLVDGLRRLSDQLGDQVDGPLAADLSSYLSIAEVSALADRVATLMERPVFPLPPADRPAIPWPPL
ncbi:MAG: SCO1664 family protein [Nakamurella sp.]